MNFGQVVEAMKSNPVKARRSGWNGKSMHIELQTPDINSKMTRPYIFMAIPSGTTQQFGGNDHPEIDRIPWIPSQTDIFAEDWEIIE